MSPVFGSSMDQFARSSISCCAAIAVVAMMLSGCGMRRHQTPKCCAPYASQQVSIQVSPTSSEAAVETDFRGVGDYQSVQRSPLLSRTESRETKIDLDEVIRLAAQNSELAELIEAERHALKCGANDCEQAPLDLLLQGESLEQRNKAAGIAGTLFLRLVELNLQRNLLEETKAHLDQMADTIKAAENEGFPTAEGEDALAEGRSKLHRSESKLNESEQKLTSQLNSLINIDADHLIKFHPVYSLKPSDLQLDADAEIAAAKLNRPSIVAMESALARGLGTKSTREILSQLDSRLGLEQSKPSLKQRFLRRQLKQLISTETSADLSASTRKQQFNRILEGRQKRAQTETKMALIKIQGSLELLAIANATIDRLTKKAVLLQAKQELDASESFLNLNQNWMDLQAVKSERISTAIEHDTAILELLQAQGEFVQQTRFEFPASAQVWTADAH